MRNLRKMKEAYEKNLDLQKGSPTLHRQKKDIRELNKFEHDSMKNAMTFLLP
jgi:hypothetical protein